jgi:hypothetical protein
MVDATTSNVPSVKSSGVGYAPSQNHPKNCEKIQNTHPHPPKLVLTNNNFEI